MIRTAVCDLLGIDYPIIQGGMAWVATAELASAVSNAGGFGIIGAGNAPGEWVRSQIRLTRELTDKPFGVNVLLISPTAEEVVRVALEEKVRAVTTGAGMPGPFLAELKERGIVVMPVVASVALARRLERMGADALIAEGMESGGHIGEITSFPLVPQVVDAVKVPVIAAGGIADGRGLVAALALGAQGVQMGTRFVCSQECIAHPEYKRKIVEAKDRSTVTTGHRLGHPVRVIENRFTRHFAELEERRGISEQELIEFGTGKLRLSAIEGDVENGSVMAGQVSGLINDIRPAREIIASMVREAEEIITGLQRFRC
ncbi:MAG: enoyl-[acyl-carrier-protein] reductase FabK [Chloroflexi bacterium]|nr:enoyl-[acyl-carrier-protein] reductase FabK [Chloroflexota bacterium]